MSAPELAQDGNSTRTSIVHRLVFYGMIGIWIAYAILMTVIATNERAGRGMAVSIGVMGALFALMITYVWLLFFSARNSAFRWTLYALPAVGVVLLLFVRVEGVNGSLVPKLRFVWDKNA